MIFHPLSQLRTKSEQKLSELSDLDAQERLNRLKELFYKLYFLVNSRGPLIRKEMDEYSF